MTIQNTEASVKIENLTSAPFFITSDVLQGDPLSASIINLILASVIKKRNDVALLARCLTVIKELIHKLQNEATSVALNNTEDKTKYIQIKRKGIKDITHLKIDNFTFENVENFNYLGSSWNADNKMNTEIAEKNSKRQQSILCQFKTNKIKTPKEKH